jgi:prepilin-type N-terminal cleavage/methylation domain-containing protein
MMSKPSNKGFTLVELMVVVGLIAFMLVQAVPSLSSGVRAARERSISQKFIQDFLWARSSATASDASALNAALSGIPSVTLAINADCSWSTSVNGTSDPSHSMSSNDVSAVASMSCSGSGLTLPATFTFTSQGYVSSTGTLTMTGSSGQSTPLRVLHSGAIFRMGNAS